MALACLSICEDARHVSGPTIHISQGIWGLMLMRLLSGLTRRIGCRMTETLVARGVSLQVQAPRSFTTPMCLRLCGWCGHDGPTLCFRSFEALLMIDQAEWILHEVSVTDQPRRKKTSAEATEGASKRTTWIFWAQMRKYHTEVP